MRSEGEIKSAYRKLAKKLHPDANKHDPKAASRFAEINAAYEIVGDDDKRKAFDRGEIDAEGKPRFQGYEGFGGGPAAAASPRRPGVRAARSLKISASAPTASSAAAAAAAAGGGGGGGFEDILRNMFGGGGPRRRNSSRRSSPSRRPAKTCTPRSPSALPDAAKGTKTRVHLPTGKDVEVKIPAGMLSGQTIRLKGQGWPSATGKAGDALITVNVAPHPLFTPDGADLRLDLPITLYEAVLGGKVRVPTLDGAVELAIPPAPIPAAPSASRAKA